MVTDIGILDEILQKIKDDLEIATNILSQDKASKTNVNFYTRQKIWCESYLLEYGELCENLKNLSTVDKVKRAALEEMDIAQYDKAILALILKKLRVQKQLKRQEELRQKELNRKAEELAALGAENVSTN